MNITPICTRSRIVSVHIYSYFLYGNLLLRAVFLLLQPQSFPVAFATLSTTLFIPVALVNFSTVSPNPFDFILFIFYKCIPCVDIPLPP